MTCLIPALDLCGNAVEYDPGANKTHAHEEEQPETGPISLIGKIDTSLGDQNL